MPEVPSLLLAILQRLCATCAVLAPLLVYSASLTAWHHFSIVYSSGTPKLYVDGTLVATGLASPRSNVYLSMQDYGGQSSRLACLSFVSRVAACGCACCGVRLPRTLSGSSAHRWQHRCSFGLVALHGSASTLELILFASCCARACRSPAVWVL